MICWLCDLSFEPEEEDWHDSCDIIDGQFIVRKAVECPHCAAENTYE